MSHKLNSQDVKLDFSLDCENGKTIKRWISSKRRKKPLTNEFSEVR